APRAALGEELGEQIARFQVERFFGRSPSAEEVSAARQAASLCVPQPCDAQVFARAYCYAALSSSEMIFY
ncbi:MAG: hypothetical protein MK135_16315, partial [Polyangiaceae bacterium]|nr:hypothetical protein [Polyangiaceae bacterium]